jgi:hypothetical protein
MSAYRELCEHYQPGDQLYFFGFSRGAYTVRSLTGLVMYAGIADIANLSDKETWARIERIFQKGYRRKLEGPADWQHAGWRFAENPQSSLSIRFLGVWDTVGALGIPDDMAVLNLLDIREHDFHDTELSSRVTTARHAVALDEIRATFQPTLWTSDHPDLRQIWFPGVHSDVGGGYAETGLADGALQWMLGEAKAAGLAFNDRMTEQIEPNHHGMLHDSCQGAFSLLPTQPRGVPHLGQPILFHDSAIRRLEDPPIHQCPYREIREFNETLPMTLDIFSSQPWNHTGIWLEAGIQYHFRAAGEWMDSSIVCGPKGTDDGNFQLGELAQMAGTVLGKAEELFKKISRNRSASFAFTRRHETMPWFALVGAIANGTGIDGKQKTIPHESFLIGSECSYTPKKSGYFYAYANDAWNCYGNNRGRVSLAIRVS